MAPGGIQKDLQQWSSSSLDHIIWISSHEEENGQKNEARENTNPDAGNHDLWAFNRWIGNFLDPVTEVSFHGCKVSIQTVHVGDSIETCKA